MRVLWVTGAAMQLCAAIAYALGGAGVVFWLLQLFVLASCTLAVAEALKEPRSGSGGPPWVSVQGGPWRRWR